MCRVRCLGLFLLGFVWRALGQTRAQAEFQDGPVTGTVTFSQVDPTERVRVSVNLAGLKDANTKWTINAFPVVTDCSEASVGGTYNPTKASASMGCAGAPKSQCLTGDLSGKLGPLNSNAAQQVFYDETLSLQGAFSILFRSVVLTGPDDHPIACATIRPSDPLVVLEAKFDPDLKPLDGSIWMAQKKGAPDSDTTVLIDMQTAGGGPLKGALYHVHEGTMIDASTPCASLGYHFNPLNGALCTLDPGTWKECELGDISGRHGPLALPSKAGSRLFFTDTFLPLSGDYSMSGRSVVIHTANGTRLACADLVEVPKPFFKISAAGAAADTPAATAAGANGTATGHAARGKGGLRARV